MKARDVHAFAESLAGAVGAGTAMAAGRRRGTLGRGLGRRTWKAHRGRPSGRRGGERQPAAVHKLVRAMNDALGNTGTTVTYGAAVTESRPTASRRSRHSWPTCRAGKVDTLVILGGNPVFTAPADLDFTGALAKVGTRVHVGLYDDETAGASATGISRKRTISKSWGTRGRSMAPSP